MYCSDAMMLEAGFVSSHVGNDDEGETGTNFIYEDDQVTSHLLMWFAHTVLMATFKLILA